MSGKKKRKKEKRTTCNVSDGGSCEPTINKRRLICSPPSGHICARFNDPDGSTDYF